jgi:hypothetical protein
MSAVLNAAVEDGRIPKNPAAGAYLPRIIDAPVRILEPAEIYAVADAVPETLRAAVIVAAGTGLRQGELYGLTKCNIDLLHQTLQVRQQLISPSSGLPVLAPSSGRTSLTPSTRCSHTNGPADGMTQLWVVHHLNNIDKHRRLLTMIACLDIDSGQPWWRLPPGVNTPGWWFNALTPLRDGDVVARFDFHGTPAPDEFDPRVSLAMTLDKGPLGHWLRVQAVTDMLEGVLHTLTFSVIAWNFMGTCSTTRGQ